MNEIEAIAKLDEALTPLDDDARTRVMSWAIAKFMPKAARVIEPSFRASRMAEAPTAAPDDNGMPEAAVDDGDWKLGPKASRWAKSHNVSVEQLEKVFHKDGKTISIIVTKLSGSTYDQTEAAYLLAGVTSFLSTDDPRFQDDTARDICRDMGCYDRKNHTTYLKRMNNKISGSKSSGWILPGPGLIAAADVVKSLAGDA